MDDFNEKQTKTSGFTLIEVLIALGVGAVLYGLVWPMGKRVIQRVHLESDKIKMPCLVMDVLEHADVYEGMRNLLSCVEALARANPAFNDLGIYQSPRRRGGIRSKSILGSNGSIASDLRESDFDYILVHPLPQNGNASTIPVCYTRGLLPSGQWAPNGLYGSQCGLIAFADAHVEMFRGTVSKDILAYIFSNTGG